ncbi:MAG TPA: hypothetical protein VNK49_04940 [Anaerolineales bacterium]|nr:hypothetical protein [Anaerolineales bacterium]
MDEQQKYLPEIDQIGLLTSTILLAFVLARLIPSPEFEVEMQLPGFFFSISLNLSTIMSVLTAGLAASGMDWLLREHPALEGRNTVQWWMLPTLTTFVVSVSLAILPSGSAWLIGFVVGGTLLFFVFLAEYIVVDADAPYYALSLVGLTAISYTLFFLFAAALRFGGVRLFLLVPALFLAAVLASLRILHLRLSKGWEYGWAIGIGLVCVQIAAGLHYWPLTPVQFGLMLTGPLYGLINLAISLGESVPARRAALEPAVATAVCWGLAIFVR